MSIVFTKSSFRESDIRETLVFMLASADARYVQNADLARFEQGFIDEVYYLLPGDEEDKHHAERYIRDHREELYRIAHDGRWETGMPLMAEPASRLQAEFSVEAIGHIAETATQMFRFENTTTHERKLVRARDVSEAWEKLAQGKYLGG